MLGLDPAAAPNAKSFFHSFLSFFLSFSPRSCTVLFFPSRRPSPFSTNGWTVKWRSRSSVNLEVGDCCSSFFFLLSLQLSTKVSSLLLRPALVLALQLLRVSLLRPLKVSRSPSSRSTSVAPSLTLRGNTSPPSCWKGG
jgi:hypothetical protein